MAFEGAPVRIASVADGVAIPTTVPGGVAATLAAGSAVVGKVGIDQTSPGVSNAVAVKPVRSTAAVHRDSVVTPLTTTDKLATPTTPTTADVTTLGSLLLNTAYYAAVAAGNRYGSIPSAVSSILTTANDGNNTHALRVTIAQVAGAEWYDIFVSTSSTAPLWVARITEAQRAAAGTVVTAVGTVASSGPNAAGTVDVRVIGTGLAQTVAPFITNNAYTPAIAAGLADVNAINCVGKSKLHLYFKLGVTDLRSLPTLRIIPFFRNSLVASDWYAGDLLTEQILTDLGCGLQQYFVLDVEAHAAVVLLVDTISGQGSGLSITYELT